MGKLNDLVTESFKIATEKGWHTEDRTLSAITLLMQSEIAEVVEEYRKHKGLTEIWYEVHYSEGGIEYTTIGEPGDKPCGIPIEIADAVIRIADYCGKVSIDLDRCFYTPQLLTEEDGFEGALAHINYTLSQAWFHRKDPQTVASWLGVSVRFAFDLANRFGIDLWAAIDEKTTYNRTRSYRHGNKRI
jgi:hypothetical protein